MSQIVYTFDDTILEQKIIGPMNQNLDLINHELGLSLIHTNNYLVCEDYDKVNLESLNKLKSLIAAIQSLKGMGVDIHLRDLIHIVNCFKESSNYDGTSEEIIKFYKNKILILNTSSGKKIYAKTLAQKNYLEILDKNSIVFCLGSAGTGKTYLAVAYAVNALKKNLIKKIIITRPAVEAGEKLGFLPGDLKEKVDPYLIPIYDALNDFLDKENVDKYIEKGVIEIAPLAYMRGRTLDHACIILDEAQNTTNNQMKMFITRLGFDSKMIITGDESQIDLNHHQDSGLIEATKILQNIKGIGFMAFTKHDVMRHPLVGKIIERYENND